MIGPFDDQADGPVPSPRTNGETDWADFWNRKLVSLGPAAFRELNERIREASLRYGLWGEIHRGVQEPIPFMCRPRLMDRSCRRYVQHVAWQVRMGLRRMIQLVAHHPHAAALLPMTPEETEWLRTFRRPYAPFANPAGSRLFCRLDAFVRFRGPGWRNTLKFMETNGIGTGGITYAPAAEELFTDIVVPAVLGGQARPAVERNADPRRLLYEELQRHARSLGLGQPPVVAFLDDKSLYTFGGELGRLTAYYESLGLPAVFADPEELRSDRRGRLSVRGLNVDLCFRFLELADFAEMESRGVDLDGTRAAFSRGLMFPSAGGDLEHKSAFELLTNPDFAPAFSQEQRRVFREHVLWTRLLFERKTPLPDGRVVDLAEHARKHRHLFVLKPNRGSGGQGVVIGECENAAAWEEALQRGLEKPGTWVLQWAFPADPEDFPEGDASEIRLAPHHSTAGFFPCRTGLGVFGRHARSRVVNLQQGGGVVPFLVNAP